MAKVLEDMNELKILLLDIVKPLKSPGGCSVHRLELVNNLARLNHEVHIISMRNLSFSTFKTIKCYYISTEYKPLLYINYAVLFLYLAIFKQFDAVYTRDPNIGFLACLIFRKLKGNNVIHEVNGIAADEQKLIRDQSRSIIAKPINIFTQKINDRILEFMRTYTLKNASFIISVTEGIKKHLIKFYGIDQKRICVIGNGANIEIFKPLDKKTSIRKLKLNETNCYVCFSGLLAPWQGVEHLIQAAPLILTKIHNAQFLIIGDGQMKKEWMLLANNLGISDMFIFTGKVPYEQVPLYINASDVCVAPFIVARNAKIGLSPLKMYEYLACGKPVVASNIPGVSDLLDKSGGGIAVTPENSREFADAVINLLQNKDLSKQMGANGRKYVVENHSWASVAKKVAKVCENVIAEKNKRR